MAISLPWHPLLYSKSSHSYHPSTNKLFTSSSPPPPQPPNNNNNNNNCPILRVQAFRRSDFNGFGKRMASGEALKEASRQYRKQFSDFLDTPLGRSFGQNARSLSFPCQCARTEAGSDSGLWRQYALKLQTHSFIWILFLWVVWMLFSRRIKDGFSIRLSKLTPKWVVVVSSLLLLMVKLLPKSKQKKPMNVSFDDLVGVDDAKYEFQVILRILKGEGEYKKLNLPDGILLYGPRRTGKSTLVHALASESKVPFFPVAARDLASDRTQDGVVEIKKLFLEARKCSPSIVFIEDVHIIASWGKSCESHPALKELYAEMDECFRDGSRVAVIAETNRPETLDRMSSDWFYTRLHVGKLNKDAKRKIIGLHLKEFLKEKDKEVICNLVASRTPDLTWGHLENIANRCARIAVFRGDDHVTKEDVLEALEFVN